MIGPFNLAHFFDKVSLDSITLASARGLTSPPMSVSSPFQEPCLDMDCGVSQGGRSPEDVQEGEERATLKRKGRTKEREPSGIGLRKGLQERGLPLPHPFISMERKMKWKIKLR